MPKQLSNADTKNSEFKSISFVDFVTDFTDLIGTNVEVSGFGLMLGDSLIVYAERGSMQAIWIDITKADRDVRRTAISKCGSGCEIVVKGRTSKYMGQNGITAVSLSVR